MFISAPAAYSLLMVSPLLRGIVALFELRLDVFELHCYDVLCVELLELRLDVFELCVAPSGATRCCGRSSKFAGRGAERGICQTRHASEAVEKTHVSKHASLAKFTG